MKLNRCHSGGHSIQQVWFNSPGTVPEMTDDSKDTRTAQNTNLHYTIQIKGFCVEDQPQERNKSGIDMFITGWIRAKLVIQQTMSDYVSLIRPTNDGMAGKPELTNL